MLRVLRGAGAHPAGRAVVARLAGVAAQDGATLPLMGLQFRNRVGVGAGFDKDGLALPGWAALGPGIHGGRDGHPAAPSPETRGRASSDWPPTRRSSIGWASTTPARLRWHGGSCSRAAPSRMASWSASTSGALGTPIPRRRSTTTSPAIAWWRRWPTTWPSTSRAPTRRACATCRILAASRACSRRSPTRARRAGSGGPCSSSWRRISHPMTWTSCCGCLSIHRPRE